MAGMPGNLKFAQLLLTTIDIMCCNVRGEEISMHYCDTDMRVIVKQPIKCVITHRLYSYILMHDASS